MKVYLLVEGISCERIIYPLWFKSICKNLENINDFEEFKAAKSGIYVISGNGYPSILNHIENSVRDVINIGNIDHFFIILDADETEVDERELEIKRCIDNLGIKLNSAVHIIVQNRCFETLLLGNRKAIPRAPQTDKVKQYKNYFDVTSNDPELMGNYDNEKFTHSQFHAEYARKALQEKRIRYTKSNPMAISDMTYFAEIIKRNTDTNHLSSVGKLIQILNAINTEMNQGTPPKEAMEG